MLLCGFITTAEMFAAAQSLRQLNARVECFAKGARLNDRKWRVAIVCDTVLVMTAQQLLNMLGAGVATLQQVQLLVSTWPVNTPYMPTLPCVSPCWQTCTKISSVSYLPLHTVKPLISVEVNCAVPCYMACHTYHLCLLQNKAILLCQHTRATVCAA